MPSRESRSRPSPKGPRTGEGPGNPGETEKYLRKVDDPKAFDEAMADLMVFINLVHDRCDAERDRDILIQRGTGKIFAVDFSQAFDPKNGTVPGCDILRCSRSIYQKLLDWNQDQVNVLLGPYLNGEETRALHARAGLILGMIRKRVEIAGENAVLF